MHSLFGVAFCLTCLIALPRQLGFVPFSKPPKVGERVDEIIQRLGPPHFDSRKDGDPESHYRLGYTDSLGTRHHLTISKGVVVKIEYSSK
jgi:hypothetical protein